MNFNRRNSHGNHGSKRRDAKSANIWCPKARRSQHLIPKREPWIEWVVHFTLSFFWIGVLLWVKFMWNCPLPLTFVNRNSKRVIAKQELRTTNQGKGLVVSGYKYRVDKTAILPKIVNVFYQILAVLFIIGFSFQYIKLVNNVNVLIKIIYW